ncbi:MAG TPA: class I SAM-dependent methyltransferase [Planctomycetota bacterium]|nr:class I SAM-dependent methyltransferase [Planctomycetota bacterium]
MGDAFKDHFSGHAADYRASRPTYPPALFDWLAEHAPDAGTAIDLGCGNGQASLGLAERFARVLAIDPSAAQIAQAEPHPRIVYAVAPAEATGLPAASGDLVLAAQSFHWFDHARFFPELARIARPGALFAAVSYATCRVTPEIDAAVRVLYHDLLDACWPPERRHVEAGYRTLPFPLDEIGAPALELTMRWDLRRMDDYLGTWSAVKAWQRAHGADPRERIAASLAAAWGDPALERVVRWPLAIRAGRLP